jgi:hypothetical protein
MQYTEEKNMKKYLKCKISQKDKLQTNTENSEELQSELERTMISGNKLTPNPKDVCSQELNVKILKM